MLPFEPAAVVSIVTEAAHLALQLHGRSPVEVKPDNTLVTAADRQLEIFLRQKLAPLAPEYSFLGEEGGLSGDPEAPAWVIDPIDGTTNFVRGIPLWCVSVGLVHKGRSILGAVAVPTQGELYWGVEGGGAWLQGLDAGSEIHRLQTPDRVAVVQEDLIAYNTTVEKKVDFSAIDYCARNFGSVAYHMLALARGSLVAAIATSHKIYDIAGGMAICREAGCEACYLDGTPWSAEVTMNKSRTPLLVAPPNVLKLLLEGLNAKSFAEKSPAPSTPNG